MKAPRSIVAGLLAGFLASLLFASAVSALEVGQKAPDFTLNGTDGKPVKLSDLTAKGPIVLYTFIAAFTGTWTKEMLGFEAAMPQFEALGAQVVGVSTDPAPSLAAWRKENNAGGKQILLSDFPRRQMLTAYGALETNEQSPVYRYAKRAYFIIDKTGTVKYVKIMDSPLNLLSADEVLKALKDSGAA